MTVAPAANNLCHIGCDGETLPRPLRAAFREPSCSRKKQIRVLLQRRPQKYKNIRVGGKSGYFYSGRVFRPIGQFCREASSSRIFCYFCSRYFLQRATGAGLMFFLVGVSHRARGEKSGYICSGYSLHRKIFTTVFSFTFGATRDFCYCSAHDL